MYDLNKIIELVGEDCVTDAEHLMDFIVDYDMGEAFVEWMNSNKKGE